MGASNEQAGPAVLEQAAGEPALEDRRHGGDFSLWDCIAELL